MVPFTPLLETENKACPSGLNANLFSKRVTSCFSVRNRIPFFRIPYYKFNRPNFLLAIDINPDFILELIDNPPKEKYNPIIYKLFLPKLGYSKEIMKKFKERGVL